MPAQIKLEIIPLRDSVDNCEIATVSKTADDIKTEKANHMDSPITPNPNRRNCGQ